MVIRSAINDVLITSQLRCTQTKRKRKRKRKRQKLMELLNGSWVLWSESESESEISRLDYIDLYCGNSDQVKVKAKIAFAFARSGYTLRSA